MLLCQTCLALAPPDPGEIEQYRQDGTLSDRQARATSLGNDRFDPALIYRIRQMRATAQGEFLSKFTPPTNWTGGLPATGNPKTLVILIDFPDCPSTGGTTVCPAAVGSTLADVSAKFFGDGDSADVPYESLRNYYQRASYDTLNIGGDVLGWFRAAHERSYYQGLCYEYQGNCYEYGTEEVVKEALDYYAAQGQDFAQYDNDGNGVIDAIYVKWTGPDNGWANFWWAYQTSWWYYNNYTVDGKKLGRYVWSWITRSTDQYHARTDIHETGHLLGLPDYYDYDGSVGPKGGVGNLDIMDGGGGHNAFSKAMLGWLTPIVVSDGSRSLTMKPSGNSPDAVLIGPGASGDVFSEFFIAQYRMRGVGNDPGNYPADGMLIWHVNAALKADGSDFLYDNSYTDRKLLRLMEADGLEQIEQSDSASADAGDFYVSPKALTPSTTPNSNFYDPASSGSEATVPSDVYVTDISAGGGETMSATFSIGEDVPVSGPDLVISSVTSPSTGTLGGEIQVSATLKNQGTETAPESLLLFYFSTDDIITLDDIADGVGGCYMPELAAGANNTCADSIPIPADLAAGTYYLGAYADTQEAVEESVEDNNGLAASNRIVITAAHVAEDYFRKVNAYFLGGLGRAATTQELDDWGTVLRDNSGSVWRPTGGGLQPYLSGLAGWGNDSIDGSAADSLIDEVLVNLFGSSGGIHSDIKRYYVELLVLGSIRPRGLVNAVLNDLAIMPRADGTYGQPNGWLGGPGDGLLTEAQILDYKARIESLASNAL